MQLPATGDVFEGRYEIVAVLGEGAFGRVYRARDLSMQRPVALKVLSPRGEEYATLTAARFVREAKLLADLQDPHTLTLYDFGEATDGLLYMATEFIEGTDLKQLLLREQRLPEPVTIHIMRQLLSSLREAHSNGLLHRDIKPANILVYPYEQDRYRVKLLDFGLAKSVSVDATQLTGAGRVAGTPRYMSPEQVLGVRLTPASDLYSLGLVAYEMLLGEPAIDGADMKELLQAQVAGPPVTVPEPFASPQLRQIVARMTERNLRQRASSAQSVLTQLETLQRSSRGGAQPRAQAPVPARQAASVEAPTRRASRTMIAIGASAIAFALLALAWFIADQEPGPVDARSVELDKVLQAPPPRVEQQNRQEAAPRDTGADLSGPSVATPGPCGRPQEIGVSDSRVHTLKFGVDSEMATVLPTDYDPHRAYPLVVLLHDTRSTAVAVVWDSQIRYIGADHDFIVIAPRDRSVMTWRDVDSLDVVHDAIEFAKSHACIDPERIYLWGHGFGSNAALATACERSDIAAIATSYYRFDRILPCLSRPIPHIMIAGKLDGYAPVEGGTQCVGRKVMSFEEQNTLWKDHNRCQGPARRQKHCSSWTCEAEFRSCLLPGGRRFKGQDKRSIDLIGCDGPPTTVDVSDLIWEFFDSKSLSQL